MKDGWISLHRNLLDHPLWSEKPYDRARAWVDLLLLANHKEGYLRVRGNKIPVKRGQVGWSVLALSKRWGWSRGKVKRFLKELENGQQIGQQKNAITSLITIVNYDKYQKTDSETGNRWTADGQQTDTNNKNNKENNDNNNNTPAPPAADDAVLLKIPDKIKDRFSSHESLRQFYFSCKGKVELMSAYLDYAAAQNAIKNPIGFAVSLAKERGSDGPPDNQSEENMTKNPKQCSYCDLPAVKYTVHDREEVGLCEPHLLLHRELKEKYGCVTAEMFNRVVNPTNSSCSPVPEYSKPVVFKT